MNIKKVPLAIVSLLLFSLTTYAFAQGIAAENGGADWFFVLEQVGVLFAIATSIILSSLSRMVDDMIIAQIFRSFMWGIFFIVIALSFRAINEFLRSSDFSFEIIFELFIYIAIFFMFHGSFIGFREFYLRKNKRL